MLRDVLRRHPNLACPEETHFFRSAEPFGSPGYMKWITVNPTLQKHRHMDGIGEAEFASMLRASVSRADLYQRYMHLFIKRNKPEAKRWFDKTPQNVYGAAMAAHEFPRARFVHIVRNPVNVVASLRIGKVMKVDSLIGACNYWNEAHSILSTLRRAYPARVHDLRYEDFVKNPMTETRRILEFVREPFDEAAFRSVVMRESRHDEDGSLTPEETERVELLCLDGRTTYGYKQAVEAS